MKQILRELNQRPIAYYPAYRKITGSTTAGILLSQLMYWFSKQDKIFKIDREIMEETLLTKKELENSKKLIKQLDFITVSREGIPAKTYYEIDWEKFEIALKNISENSETSCDHTEKQVSTNGGNCTPPMGETYIVKSLTETTTEKKSKKKFFTSDDLAVAQYLFAYIKGIYAGSKEPNWNDWANTVRLMRERDGRDLEAIKNVLDLIFVDNGVYDGKFWKQTIRSTKNLRKHYERIASQIAIAYEEKNKRSA